jgi:hypothetical protein
MVGSRRVGVHMRTFRNRLPVLLVPLFFVLSPSAISAIVTLLVLALAPPARSQEPSYPMESIVQAAREARERKANSTKHPKIITNADLSERHSAPTDPSLDLRFPETYGDDESNPPANGCDNPEAARLAMELQALEQDLDQLHRELSYQPEVISNGDLDLEYFKPGGSGLYVGSPPLLEVEPPVPARVAEAQLEERIASLQKALRIACEPPEAARMQSELDQAEQELDLLQRQLDLDQDSYYSNADYAEDREGASWLDYEQQQIDYLQSQIERLRQNLAVLTTP